MRFQLSNINFELSLLGGQSFVWRKLDSGYLGLHSDYAIFVELAGTAKAEQIYGQKINLKDYFQEEALQDFLRSDASRSCRSIEFARDKLGEILLLRQSFQDAFFSFLLSSNNSILRIRRSVFCLSQKLGQKVKFNGEDCFLFPKAETLAQASLDIFYDCGAGYRAEYIAQSAQDFLDKKSDLERLREKELVFALKEFKGVGDKVADCIAVFSGKAKTFSPMDRWAKRAISRSLKAEFRKYADYRDFLGEKFGKHARFAGQYLFEYERSVNM